MRLQRKVQRMRLQSDAAQLKRELAAAQESLRLERRYQQSLEQELRQVQRARLANSQSGQWQLGAVQLYHNRVVQAAPVRVSLWCVFGGFHSEQACAVADILLAGVVFLCSTLCLTACLTACWKGQVHMQAWGLQRPCE
jgi:hypothetical protein